MYSSKRVIKRGTDAEIQNYLSVAASPHRLRADDVWKFFSERQRSAGLSDAAEEDVEEDEMENDPDVLEGDSEQEDGAAEAAPVEEEEEPELSEAELKAQEILSEARAEAERIREDAHVAAERIRESAHEKGYQLGFEEGQDAGRADAEAKAEQAFKVRAEDFRKETERVFRQIDSLKQENLRLYLNELKDVAIKVAEKVIHVSLQSSGEVIKRMILNEADKMRKTAWLKIYIDKSDYQMLVKADANIASELSKVSESIKFVVMERDDSGNLILETPEEIVDMGVHTQMENLRERLSQVEV